MPHICPVSLCGQHVKRAGSLICRDCWSRVPARLRTGVNRSWRAYRAEHIPGNTSGLFIARRAYLNARQGAIDAAEASRP